MNTHWTKSEIKYLTINANTMTNKQLSAGLDGRTIGGVRDKLRMLGMSAKREAGRCGVKLRIREGSPLLRG